MEEKSKIQTLKQFIKNNGLTFTGEGSALNSDCTILAGYALYIGADVDDCIIAIPTSDCGDEMHRVFDYASDNNYGVYWKSELAQSSYKYKLV